MPAYCLRSERLIWTASVTWTCLCHMSFTRHLLPQNQTLLKQCIIKTQKKKTPNQPRKNNNSEHKCTVSKRYFFLYYGSDPQLLEIADVGQDCATLILCRRLLFLWPRCRRKCKNSSAVGGLGYSLNSGSPMVSL